MPDNCVITMPTTRKSRKTSQARRAELERRLNEIRSQETTIKERIYKLEASIAAAPGLESARRLRLWNTVPAEDSPVSSRPRVATRYQRQLRNRGRSGQALTALGLFAVGVLLVLWLSYQLRTYGLL